MTQSGGAATAPAPVKLVFLDCDGVVSPLKGKFFEDAHMQRLKRIVESCGAEIVLSSSWRLTAFGRNEVNKHLTAHGMREIIGCTAELKGESRSAEIMQWVAQHQKTLNIVNFVALDDIPLVNLAKDKPFFSRHCVTTDGDLGLTDADAARAIELLKDDNNIPLAA